MCSKKTTLFSVEIVSSIQSSYSFKKLLSTHYRVDKRANRTGNRVLLSIYRFGIE